MRFRRAPVVAVAALMMNGAQAGEDRERDRFIATYRCEALSRLTQIHEVGPQDTSKDRFLILALPAFPQRYVQCLFLPGNRMMFCEASSGAYRFEPQDGQALAMSAEAATALQKLGFSQEDASENYKRELDLGSPPRLERAATLMLAALYDAYQARPGDGLAVTAPKAPDVNRDCLRRRKNRD